MDRTALLWTLVVFFGASIVFRVIRNATEDEPAGVTILVALLAFGVMAGLITLVVRRRG